MAVRLFVGNLSYTTTEADLRTYFGTVAPPSQVVLPVDRETGRPRGFAFVEYPRSCARRAGDSALQRSDVQRPAAGGQRGARPRGSRPRRLPDRGRAAAVLRGRGRAADSRRARRRRRRFGFGSGAFGAVIGPRRNFGPDAKPQRGAAAKKGKKDDDRPRGPIPVKATRPLVHRSTTTMTRSPTRRSRTSTTSRRASPRTRTRTRTTTRAPTSRPRRLVRVASISRRGRRRDVCVVLRCPLSMSSVTRSCFVLVVHGVGFGDLALAEAADLAHQLPGRPTSSCVRSRSTRP